MPGIKLVLPAFALLALRVGAQSVSTTLHDIPLLNCSGLPCVELTAGSGKTLKLLIDLSSINAYLDLKGAANLGLDTHALKSADGSEITAVQQTTVPGARLGDLPLGDFPFMVFDTVPDANGMGGKRSLPLPADGALAYGSFQNRILQLDFAKRIVRVSEPQDSAQICSGSCGDMVARRVGQYGPATLTVNGFELDAHPVTAQIDTLFQGTLLVYPGSVQKLGLKKATKAKGKEEFPYTFGGVKLAKSNEHALSFRGVTLTPDGPLYFWASKEEAPPEVTFDAKIGAASLARGVVTLDFKGMHLWIEPAAH